PDFAEVFYYVRHPDAEVARKVYERLVKCAQGGALATETKLEIGYLGGTVQLVPNGVLADLARTHLRKFNDLRYDDEERKFARRLQETLTDRLPLESIGEVDATTGGQPGMGSTDVSDVSWVVPTGGFSTACWVPGTPAHSWQATAAGGTSIGRKGVQLAAPGLAAHAWGTFPRPKPLAPAPGDPHQRPPG